MEHKILFVDDDLNLLASFQRSFRKVFQFETATGASEALSVLRNKGPFSVIVSDMRMPGMDGIEFLEICAKQYPHSIRVMLTGNADQHTAVEAVNRGSIFRFVNKPCPPDDLIPVVEAAIEQYRMSQIERDVMEGTTVGCVKVLGEILGMVSPESLGRGQRLRESVHRFAEFLEIKNSWEIELGALLSSIGYASLPSSLLRKALGEKDFTPNEAVVIKRLPSIGHDLIAGIPRLKPIAEIILYQNQHFDGQGYPADGCAGEAIPIGARIIKIIADRAELESDGIVKQYAYEALKTRTGVYDGFLLEKSFECFPTFLSYSLSAEKKVHTVSTSQLKVGQVVVSDIHNFTGTILLGSGSKITEMVMQRLRNYAAVGDIKEPIYVQNS